MGGWGWGQGPGDCDRTWETFDSLVEQATFQIASFRFEITAKAWKSQFMRWVGDYDEE
jgi:hypothetical protein